MARVAPEKTIENSEGHGAVGNCLIGGSWLLAGICFPCAISEGVQIVQEYERAVIFRILTELYFENISVLETILNHLKTRTYDKETCCGPWVILYSAMYRYICEGDRYSIHTTLFQKKNFD